MIETTTGPSPLPAIPIPMPHRPVTQLLHNNAR
jgi:hypothetical protein